MASVNMIRFGYFHKDIKDEEKERARHEEDCTPVRGAMRQARNHAKPRGPHHNKGKAAFEGLQRRQPAGGGEDEGQRGRTAM